MEKEDKGSGAEDKGPEQLCCLFEDSSRCRRPAGNASYSKRIQKIVSQRRLKLHLDPSAPHIYICDMHKSLIQSARTKRKRKDSEDDSGEHDPDYPDVDLSQLSLNTLRRYKRQFKVPARPGLSKVQLSDILQKQFKALPVNEKDIISAFLNIVKSGGNKIDQKVGLEYA